MLATKASAAVMELVGFLLLASSTDLITSLQLLVATGQLSYLFLVFSPMSVFLYQLLRIQSLLLYGLFGAPCPRPATS